MSRSHLTANVRPRPPVSVRRCLAVWAFVTSVAAGAGALCAQAALPLGAEGWPTLVAPGHLEDLVVAVGGAVGVLALGWIWTLVSVTVVGVLRGRVTPTGRGGAVRRAVLALCGVALTTALAGPGHASVATDPPGLAGLPYPDRAAVGAGTPSPGDVSDRAPEDLSPATPVGLRPDVHVVRPGESLWDIAATTLPRHASAAEVDARWRQVHDSNRDVVGDDPDLIHPGQELLLPETTQGDQS